ncbi:glycogen phosphorylase [Clostridium homopropionicum DSM 5847]|uniref:Alpha-1,4 glucan phosphorylase n=1 Tax=Clostridium homopropionicum DSM 5847 TaxID=1121318 RepID=A0A0L6Z9M1_9CLOT|nr:glycogen/starch/alpha-glucan phosphorylase [Clostridium homopropionicum]KOA19664.1 glycogen phosphorylase [Clostridium homopropionicum DSM 5847]SFF80567.1 starch phosphorylase [Clostridium homopropionicum]
MIANKDTIKKDFAGKVKSMFGKNIEEASSLQKYEALADLIRDYSSINWSKTNSQYKANNEKQVYYFSMEFLIGRLLKSNLYNLGIEEECRVALKELGIKLEEIEEQELDAGLGNGGLGRLAACFLDSMASLGIPGHGCGIRYKYGLFEQKIVNGYQIEIPDNWLKEPNPWEVRKDNKAVVVKLGGRVIENYENGYLKFTYENYQGIKAVPYDIPIIGYDNKTVNTLRLWSAEALEEEEAVNLNLISRGEYFKALEDKASVESISQVLYPDDSKIEGKLLRLKQQYFFVSAGVQSIIRSYKSKKNHINDLYKYVAIHINDTHPSLAVPELMRILIDEEGLEWDKAFEITNKTISYTNHTIMAEAMEKWQVDMFKGILPRIYMIVQEINRRFVEDLKVKYKMEQGKINKMSIINENHIKMANLAIVGGYSVNGVARLHTEILKKRELKDFYELYPEKFNNKTNGITHRRWLLEANPSLSKLICSTIGTEWIKKPEELINLKKYSRDAAFQDRAAEIKKKNKIEFSKEIKDRYGVEINPYSIFDVQVKRLHEYKRQILNLFNIINLYFKLKENPNLDIVPRTFFFAAKASPSYLLAKEIIKLITTVQYKINNDRSIKDKIKVLFLENYGVSLAEKIIPCADISEQISTASKEASGTGNMKFMMNGAITLATLDGANVEIREAVGEENIIIFGLNADEVMNYERYGGYNSKEIFNRDPIINKIVNSLINGYFQVPNCEFINIYKHLIDKNDEYFIFKDFHFYVNAQEKAEALYKNYNKWKEMSVINIAHSGRFSSDKTIENYSKEIWNTRKVNII